MAVAGGLLMALSFPLGPPLPIPNIQGFWPAAWFCLAPVILAALRARNEWGAARYGLVSGMTAFGLLICWIDPFLVRWANLSHVEAAAVFLLLVTYVAIYFGAFAVCVRAWSRRWGSATACLLAPVGWCALEWTRGILFTGFPWCLLGYSQMPALAVVQVADLAGVYGVSFVLAASGALVAILVERPGSSRRASLAVLTGILVTASGYGAWRLAYPPRKGAGEIKAALVQTSVAQSDKWDPDERLRIEADHFEMTRRAAGRGAGLVVWSESAVPASITHDPAYARRLEDLARETGADLLLGTVSYESRDGANVPFNSAVIVGPAGGVTGRYDKIHLVPFGEYVPLKGYLFFLEPLVQEASDFHPGEGVTLLQGGGAPLGALICYEAIFPALVRRFTLAGAQVLVNITNDAWYEDTAMPRQHLMQAAMRAVENRRPLLRCANTGISAIVEPTGRIVSASRLGEKTILEGSVRPADQNTLYAGTGDVFAILCVILTASSMAAALIPRSPGGHHAG
jgi:apolipoprotein N-acyltransferase